MGNEEIIKEPERKKLLCECCRIHEAIGVASSPLGAISLAYCRYCLGFNAQPEWLVAGAIDINGGWERTAEWVKYITIPVGPKLYAFADEILTEEALERYKIKWDELEK